MRREHEAADVRLMHGGPPGLRVPDGAVAYLTQMGLSISEFDDLVLQCYRWQLQVVPAASWRSRWPARSSSCRRCMTAMIAPVFLLLRRETRVPPYQSTTLLRASSDWASEAFSGSSMMIVLAASACQRATHRGCVSAAASGRDELESGFRLAHFVPVKSSASSPN